MPMDEAEGVVYEKLQPSDEPLSKIFINNKKNNLKLLHLRPWQTS